MPALQAGTRPVLHSCFETRQHADLPQGSCPSPSPTSSASARCPMQRATSTWATKTTWLNQKDPAFLTACFCTSPTIITFIRPRIYWHAKLRTTTRSKPEVLGFLLQIIPIGKWQCFSLYGCIYPYTVFSAAVGHPQQSHCAGEQRGRVLPAPTLGLQQQ